MKSAATIQSQATSARILFLLSSISVVSVGLYSPAATAAENSPASVYVDGQLSRQHCDDYDPATRQCGNGSFEAYTEISAAASQSRPGLTIRIQPGNYGGGITVNTGGDESDPVIFQAVAPGVIIEGSGAERDAFFVNEADYVVIDGLTIQGASRAAIRISQSHHVTVRNSTLTDNGTWGVFTDFSDYTVVENCIAAGSRTQHGIYISNSSDYPTIRGNRIYNNSGAGLHMNGDGSMGGDGLVSYALVENNIIFENGVRGGSAINMDGVTHSIVRNNLLYENHASGISLFRDDGSDESHSNQILHNTIVMAANARWALNVQNSRNNKLFNNIVLNKNRGRGSILVMTPVSPDFASDYNLVMDRFASDGEGDVRIDFPSWQALGFDSHSVSATAEQVFVDSQNADFRLKDMSPAIDKGITVEGIEMDLTGKPRPGGESADIGAYEF